MFEDDIPNEHQMTRHKFLLEWFGNFGRILGNPPKAGYRRYFSNDPYSTFDCIELGINEKLPSYMSVQPFAKYMIPLGIEKLFYDFDYGRKSDKLNDKQIEKRKKECAIEVMQFANYLKKLGIRPLIIFSGGKGYHIYIFFDKIYTFESDKKPFWEMVYERLMKRFVNRDYKYLDSSVIHDLARFSRIPFSRHQKTGNEVFIVNDRLERDKIRSLDFYRAYGIDYKVLKEEAEIAAKNIEESLKEAEKRKEQCKANWENEHGFVGKIRPCFIKRIETGEMSHEQRLALLVETFYSGCETEDEIVDVFRKFHDFDESITRYQVKWYLEHRNGVRPYRCSTIKEKGWCLGEDCPIWRARNVK